MTLLFADGFEDGSLAWTFANSMAVGTGRFGNGLVMGTTTSYADTGFPPIAGVMIAGAAVRPAGAGGFMGFYSDSVAQVQLSRGAGGEVIVHRQAATPVLGSSASGVLPINAWSYVELMTTVDNATGIVIVRVNGVEVVNLTNQDTLTISAATQNVLRLGGNAAANAVIGSAFDDVYLCNSLGSYNNTFLNDLTVEHLRPGADDTAQFVGSDANSVDNWALVDEAGAYAGADYVASSTVGQRDLYVPVASARSGSAGVFGVMLSAVVQKTDAGARTVRLCCKEGAGGTVRQSTELGLPTSFGETSAIFERKGDGTMFTVADVNALRMGMEVAT